VLQDSDFGNIGLGYEADICLAVLGTAAGERSPKTESLTARGLQYVLSPRLGRFWAFLPVERGVSEVLVQMPVL
jgi:hypothetical protein